MLLDIRPDHLQIVQAILQKHVPQYAVWAFGSRAKWTAKDYSDLDLCVVSNKPLSFSLLGAIAEDFSDSDLPWKVDVVDWATTSEGFRKIIERDKVVVQKASEARRSEWGNETTIGQLVADFGGSIKTGPFGTALKASEYVSEGVPLISVREIGHGSFHIDSKTPRVSPETTTRLSEYLLEAGDIVFARKGGIERCSLVRKAQAGWFLGSDGIRLRPPKNCDARFLAYSLQTQTVKDWLTQHSTGSTMASLNQATIARLPICIPSIDEQKKIASCLAALDDRITLLRETNATLEAIAQALFKSWFMDFDPIHAKQQGRAPDCMDEATAALFPDSFEESKLGLIPKGWSISNIEEIAEKVGMGPFGSNIKVSTFVSQGVPVLNGRNVQDTLLTDLDFNFITPSHAEKLKNSCVKAGDVVITHRGTLGQVALVPEGLCYDQFVVSQSQFFLRCDRRRMLPEWITYFFKSPIGQQLLLANTSQVGVPSIARPVSHLRSIKLVLPPFEILSQFSETVSALHKSVVANRQQAQTLATLRDILLPRLISGQLRLPEASSVA